MRAINSLWSGEHYMVAGIWVNIGSANDLVPDGTKPLPEPMLSSKVFCGIHKF